MIDERRETQASLYALGALPPEQMREFEAALRGDPQLKRLVAELLAAADGMVAGFAQVVPPPALKSRVMSTLADRAGAPVTTSSKPGKADLPAGQGARPRVPAGLDPAQTPGWMVWLPYALAVCFAVLCVVLISLGRNLREQALALREQLTERTGELDELKERLEQLQAQTDQTGSNYEQRLADIRDGAASRVAEIQRQAASLTNQLAREQSDLKHRLGASEADTVRLKREKQLLEDSLKDLYVANSDRLNNARVALLRPTATGSSVSLGAAVWLPNDQRGLVVFESLPTIPPSQSYQLWLVDPGATAPASAAVFTAEPTGAARQVFTSPVNLRSSERFALSVEAKGGAPRPTGKFVLTSE